MKKIKPWQEKQPRNKSKLEDISDFDRRRRTRSNDKRSNNPRNKNWI